MDFRIFTEPQQGASYTTLLGVARAAEAAGFSAFYRSDHFLKMGDVDGRPGPTDAYVTLAGLARDTDTIRLGTLVTSATFRHPGAVAVSVAQLSEMSDGRIDFSLGAGWYEAEHAAYAFPFPDLGERFERLEEQLAVITGLWDTPDGQTFSFEGRHYSVVDSPALPKPVAPVPVVVGGRGPRRTPRLAATYATEYNQPFPPFDGYRAQNGVVRAACEARDRDPDELTYSVALVACCGADDAEVARRAAAIGREVDELRQNGLCGTPDQIRDRLAQWEAEGAQRVYLQILDLHDLDHIALLGELISS